MSSAPPAPAIKSSLNNARVAAIQLVSGMYPEKNLFLADALIGAAVKQGAQLVALPEYFASIGLPSAQRLALAEPFGQGKIQDFLANTAAKYGIWLIGGSLALSTKSEQKAFNSCLAYQPDGQCVARYDKIHLFSFANGQEQYNEGATLEAGTMPCAFDTPFGRVGLSICYDIRFPELYRALGVVDLLVLPAAFTETTGRDHWEILLRARAIENQCYLLAAAQGGIHANGRETHGHSFFIDPWGRLQDGKQKGPGIVIGTLDHEKIAEIRQNLPALKHRVFA